jgi:hypothetical protein
MKDCNEVELKNGDIIDIHQTVNGSSRFIVVTVEPLEVVYAYDPTCEYQYNKEELLAPCKHSGEVDWEIVGNVNEVKS